MSLEFIKDIDQSVVILTTPRTGSTALCRVLADKCNLVYCNEVFSSITTPARIELFWDYFNRNINTVSKIFPDYHIRFTEEEFNKIISKSFVIFLERQDIANQVISYHILSRTNKPWYLKSELITEYLVDESEISVSVSHIFKLRKEAEKYQQIANVSIVYEDIVNDIVNDHIIKYPKPKNYESLKIKVDNVLSNFLKLQQKHKDV